MTDCVVIEKKKVLNWLASSGRVNIRIAYNRGTQGSCGIRPYVEVLIHRLSRARSVINRVGESSERHSS